MAPQMAPRDELHPLHAAAAAGSVAEVRRLLQQVPHQVPNAPDGAGRSAIFYAQMQGHLEAALLLGEAG